MSIFSFILLFNMLGQAKCSNEQELILKHDIILNTNIYYW